MDGFVFVFFGLRVTTEFRYFILDGVLDVLPGCYLLHFTSLGKRGIVQLG